MTRAEQMRQYKADGHTSKEVAARSVSLTIMQDAYAAVSLHKVKA